MIGRYFILTSRSIPEKNLVKAIVLPKDKKLWPEFRKNIINFRVDPDNPVFPHRGLVYVALFGKYLSLESDYSLTVSMWRQFK